jgi:hypothetical protein
MEDSYSQNILVKGVTPDFPRIDRSFGWQMGEKSSANRTFHRSKYLPKTR